MKEINSNRIPHINSLIKNPQSIIDILKWRAKISGNSFLYTFLTYSKNNEIIENKITYKELFSAVQKIGSYCIKINAKGKRGLLLYSTGIDFIKAFFSCLYSGIIAVPLQVDISPKRFYKLRSIITNSDPSFIFTTPIVKTRLKPLIDKEFPEKPINWININEIDYPGQVLEVPVKKSNIAYLQYTSGSTSNPKGVMITHENVLHNQDLLYDVFIYYDYSVGVSWLPHYHDMGLLATIVQGLYIGFPYILLQPRDFILKPKRWLQAITDYKGTHGGAPNFAYDLCVESISPEERSTLHLSSWEAAWNAAEPVQVHTIERFTNYFEICGFKKKAMQPCYGLAEATLGVACYFKEKEPFAIKINREKLKKQQIFFDSDENSRHITLVSNGKLCKDTNGIIVHPESCTECSPDIIGELWLSSPSISPGYFNNDEATEKMFKAYTKDTNKGPFFRTGDLGFFHDSQFYITGRWKEMIIIRGMNFYANDIGQIVEKSHDSFAGNGCAVFSIPENGVEQLVIAQEIKRHATGDLNKEMAVSAIRDAVVGNFDIQADIVLLIKPGGIPKTSSGKIQNRYSATLYTENKLKILYESVIRGNSYGEMDQEMSKQELLKMDFPGQKHYITGFICNRIASILNKQPAAVEINKSLISLGIDSLLMTRIKTALERYFKIQIDVSTFFEQGFTINRLSDTIFKTLHTNEDHITYHQNKNFKTNEKEEEPYPLTDLQYAYWMGRKEFFELGNTSAHVYFEIDTEEKIDYSRLNSAWQKLIHRHKMLHTIIPSNGMQKTIYPVPDYTIKLYNLKDKKQKQKEQTLLALRNDLSHQIFETARWPLFDIRLSQIDDSKSRLHISFDLIIADIWSLNILMDEWYLIYTGRESVLPPLPADFREYIQAYIELKKKPEYIKAKQYWESMLPTLFPEPQFPYKKSKQEIKEIHFTHRQETLDKNTWKTLKTKAMESGITPSNLLFSAYSKIISNWSKSSQFTLTVTLFNRMDINKYINNVVGDFTSVILVSIDDSALCGFVDFAQAVQTQCARALQNSVYSGVEVLRELEKLTCSQGKALMPVVYTCALSTEKKGFFNTQDNFFGKRGYTISQTPQVILDHQIYEDNGALILSWDSIDDLFPDSMLDNMFTAYIQFIKDLAKDEKTWTTPIRSLILKKQLKKREIYNKTDFPVPEGLLHTRFLQKARLHPDLPAIFTHNRIISYRELLNGAINLAYILIKANVQRNELVGILMHKGWEQIVAVLGILIAGAAYTSIDAPLPFDRQKYIIEKSKTTIIVTQQEIPLDNEFFTRKQIIRINSNFLNDHEIQDLPGTIQSPKDIAYVLYTSGSTGIPKGVIITHKSALNTVLDINSRFNVKENDRIVGISSLSFDLSVYDIFGMLSAGAGIILPKVNSERDPDHLAGLLEKHHATIWNSVPALFEIFVEYAEHYNQQFDLRLILLSGDWIPLSLPHRIKQVVLNKETEIISLGGATEGSIWSIYYPIKKVEPGWPSIPYGMPLRNQKIYVLNNKLGQCPDWVPGKLYIRGEGVAQGYWDNPDQTNKSFIIHPGTKERLYNTGDLGRFIPSNYIEFLGREDFQVKIGGFRVELGEIESTLNQHPKIDRTAVNKVKGKAGSEYLSAYIVLNNFWKLKKSIMNKNYEDTPEMEESEHCPIITDPRERLAFKLTYAGIRKINGNNRIPFTFKEKNIQQLYINRGSCRKFTQNKISFLRFEEFVSCLKTINHTGFHKYQYGSAGGLYPVQVYMHVKENKIEGIPCGAYYYHPREHTLVELKGNTELPETLHVITNQNIVLSSAFSIFLVGDLDAIEPLYGTRSRDFCLIEAGLITQLLEISGVHQGIGLCQIGVLADEQIIRQAFHLSERHILLHTITGGDTDYSDPTRTIGIIPEKETGNDKNILDEIKTYCTKKLPAYMVPRRWTILDKIPLTNIGKISYKDLPTENKKIKTAKINPSKPESALENTIAMVVEKILNINSIDIYTNFFDLGADSLKITHIWRALVQEIGYNFPIVKIFENPTIHQLALCLNLNKSEKTIHNKINEQVEMKKKALKRRRASFSKHNL